MLEPIYKERQKRGYIDKSFLIDDTSNTSPNYFNLLQVPTTLTAGKNIIKLGADGYYLKRNYEIDLEVLDVNGKPLYNEYTGFQDRYGYKYYIVYVYDIVPQGVGTITLVGVANNDLNGRLIDYQASEHQAEYTVRWSTSVNIQSTNRNVEDIVFQRAPDVTVSQVLTPYKFNFGTYTINDRILTQSLSDLLIYTSDNAGFDFVQNTSDNIQTVADVDNSYNYFLKSSTANTVHTNVRKYNKDVVNGFVYSEYSRYNTVLFDSQGRLTKDMEGSIFSFANLDSGVSMINSWSYSPNPTTNNFTVLNGTGSIPDQLTAYTPKIVSVYSNQYAFLDRAPTLKVVDSTNTIRPAEKDLVIKRLSNVTGSFAYPTSSLLEVQSNNLSSSYIHFTFMDFNPIAGDVYRIKTYVKEAGRNTEYYQLNDHIVNSPEFLTDTERQNQAVYAKNKSDFFVYGEFTTPSVAIDYWRGFRVQNGNILPYSFNLSSSAVTTSYPLANSLILSATNSVPRGFTTRYYQTYMPNEPYTLSFYCALDVGCELEVYMSSTPLSDTVLGLQAPRAFNQTNTYGFEQENAYSKYGKFIGKVTNANGTGRRSYDNVTFDFYPDADGFGRPVFLLKNKESSEAYGYISSISVTPLDLVGFTPSILEFAAASPDSINILQDDDASLTQSIDVKIEYFTFDGRQSEYSTYIPNLQINMINEVPGLCSNENFRFNDACPIYYEVSQAATSRTVTGIVTTDPTQYTSSYFWPTYSLNNSGDYYWNMRSFAIPGTDYSTFVYQIPISSSITSSWFRYDPILPLYSIPIPSGQIGDSFRTMYSASAAPVTYSATPIDGILTSVSPTDRRFYEGDGAAISRFELAVSQSNLLFYTNSLYIQQNPPALSNLDKYLKKSRLYFPTTTNTNIYGFYENGGIYNVRFNISRAPRFFYDDGFGKAAMTYTDEGATTTVNSQVATYTKTASNLKFQPEAGAKLMVYIADVATQLGQLELVPGREGFFPPKNNIVTIGNGYSTTPTITFFDSGSGYNIEQYDIVLVQYGERAQLVFDACGLEFELDTNGAYKIYNNTNNAFWGGIISDIQWCKIGTTTDPKFIKPANFLDAFSKFVPVTTRPPSGPIESSPINTAPPAE